jgi:hypothetical protein
MGDAYANRGSRLDSVLADMQAKKQQQMMLEQRRQQHEAELKAQYIASLMQGQPYERRAAIAQQYGIQAPEYVPNEQEMAARDLAAKQRGVVNSWSPDKFQSDTAAMTLVTDKTPNQSTSETMRDQSYMTPQGFTDKLDILAGRKMSAEQDDKSKLGWSELRTVKQPVAQSQVRDNNASAYSHTQTGNPRGEERITEQQKRDPNSGYTQTQIATAAAKGNAEAAGKVNAEAKPAQLKAANFHGRMVHALSEVEGKDGKGGIEDAIARRWYGGQQRDLNTPDALNFLRTPEAQRYRAAQREFTEARLRKESGAAIPVHEYETDAKMYFFQPGDSLDVLAQKRRARQSVIAGVAAEAGPAVAAAPLSRDEAEQFLQKAGGDPNKARELARQAGRSF